MKNKYLMIAAVVAMPLLNPAQALADDRHHDRRDGEAFYYGLSKDGYRIVIAYGDRDRDRRDYRRDRRPVRYVTYKRHDHHYRDGHRHAYAHKKKSHKHKHAYKYKNKGKGHGHKKHGHSHH